MRPLEWFNLAAIHGPLEYWLRSDLYHDRGIAEQAAEPVADSDLYPSPSLPQLIADRERLIDYAMTEYFLHDDVVQALSGHDKTALLVSLQARVAATRNQTIIAQAYEICARVVGRVAEDWIRAQWQSPHLLFALAEASAACLPPDEGLEQVMRALDALSPRERGAVCEALYWFKSPRTLDWIETHVSDIDPWTASAWGRLAATSYLTWDRVGRWLAAGRPLSLIALDALRACGRWDTLLVRHPAPRLRDPASREQMTQVVRAYAKQDATPRVERDVAWIVTHWNSILAENNTTGASEWPMISY